jgi:hypothetical protein
MMLFHVTTIAEASEILVGGFGDRGSRVWLSSCPLDENGTFSGDAILAVDIPIEAVLGYESAEGEGPCQLFLVPATIVNDYPVRISGLDDING